MHCIIISFPCLSLSFSSSQSKAGRELIAGSDTFTSPLKTLLVLPFVGVHSISSSTSRFLNFVKKIIMGNKPSRRNRGEWTPEKSENRQKKNSKDSKSDALNQVSVNLNVFIFFHVNRMHPHSIHMLPLTSLENVKRGVQHFTSQYLSLSIMTYKKGKPVEW